MTGSRSPNDPLEDLFDHRRGLGERAGGWRGRRRATLRAREACRRTGQRPQSSLTSWCCLVARQVQVSSFPNIRCAQPCEPKPTGSEDGGESRAGTRSTPASGSALRPAYPSVKPDRQNHRGADRTGAAAVWCRGGRKCGLAHLPHAGTRGGRPANNAADGLQGRSQRTGQRRTSSSRGRPSAAAGERRCRAETRPRSGREAAAHGRAGARRRRRPRSRQDERERRRAARLILGLRSPQRAVTRGRAADRVSARWRARESRGRARPHATAHGRRPASSRGDVLVRAPRRRRQDAKPEDRDDLSLVARPTPDAPPRLLEGCRPVG